MTDNPTALEGEWLHQTEYDYSPLSGAVAACRTCGWGEPADNANQAKAVADAHRAKYGRAEPPVVIDVPQPSAHRPGPKPTAQHGSTALYNRGCRCEPCKHARAAYKKARRAAGVGRRAR